MALTERYVSASGAGAHDGTSEADAFSWTEMISDINTPRAGYRYNVKGNVSPSATDTITGDGSATSPNIIRGYSSTIGDGYLGRSSGGALNTTNMPSIAYGAGFQLNASGADFLIIQDLNFSGNNSGYVIRTGADSTVLNCKVAQASTNAAAGGISMSTNAGARVLNCDVSTAASGGAAGILIQASTQLVQGCRITTPGCPGILCRSAPVLAGNTIYGCAIGVSMDTMTGTPWILGNTIYGCSGDGIDIVTATTGRQTIIGNHITDNGGYGIDFNASTCVKFLAFNRTRDNTSGAINPADDWTDGTTIAHVTTDTGGASTDYTNAGEDFSLIAAAPGISKGPGYLIDIGANGTPVVTAAAGGLIRHPGMNGGLNA